MEEAEELTSQKDEDENDVLESTQGNAKIQDILYQIAQVRQEKDQLIRENPNFVFSNVLQDKKTSSMEVTPQPSVLHSRYPISNNNTVGNIVTKTTVSKTISNIVGDPVGNPSS